MPGFSTLVFRINFGSLTGTFPIFHVMVLVVGLYVNSQVSAVADIYFIPYGILNVKTTLLAGSGPLFPTLKVILTVSPILV